LNCTGATNKYDQSKIVWSEEMKEKGQRINNNVEAIKTNSHHFRGNGVLFTVGIPGGQERMTMTFSKFFRS
jgi:hypothetical protein